ncbi:MAG: phenylalanine--tRNA ligase subunit alpha [Candidatus Dojkabacteria bacterium]|nr:MAG: phenylalanine--tRNA ligase subunit alpha [Candidatus Dojkabacteria bacterium]
MSNQSNQIEDVRKELEQDSQNLSADEIKKKYLSKGGILNSLLRGIKEVALEERSRFGNEANELKKQIEQIIDAAQSDKHIEISTGEKIDVTAPFDINTSTDKRPELISARGSQHPLTKELEYVLGVFESMGFNIEECRQIDNDYNMFEALNFPIGHPARDLWDTFWTDENLIPPAHTSTMQNRVLRNYEIPIRVVVPGRCFRNEATDASHEHTLHQIEGVYVDENISVGDMIGTIKTYLEAFFQKELKIKLQPAYFPFTEPDIEFLINCPFCNGTGCSICGGTGWIEAMGCGMIHPNVLEEAGIDSKKYTGFAWGFGLDRLVMIKHGIEDIRWLHSGDLDFIKKF